MPIRIGFYGGVGEVGGNKFLLANKDTTLFLDFGMNFTERSRFYSEPWLSPRDEKGLLEFGILPHLKGVYKFDPTPRQIDAVILSHSHADHTMSLAFLNRSIPVYCGETTAIILEAMGEIGRRNFESDISGINFQRFHTGDRIKIGDLLIEPVHVDHSVPGAYGIIVHTSEGSIVYTGDFRHHGSVPRMTEDFVERASVSEPVALLSEGTNIIEAEVTSEGQVLSGVKKVLKNTPGLVMAGFSNTDVDRFRTLYQAAADFDRKLALSARQAHILMSLAKGTGLKLPRIPSDDLIYVFRRGKRTFADWEERVFDRCKEVNAKEISAKQHQFILVSSFSDLKELIEIKPRPGSVYILSSSEPFNEEMQIEYDKFVNWLDHFGLPMYRIHSSGHIYPDDLRWAIGEIKPRKLVPIHTEHPGMFTKWASDMVDSLIPQKNTTLTLP